MDAYKESVKYLESLMSNGRTGSGPSKKPKNIERMRALLNQLGNPEKALRYVHITGTSGKGTVATLTQTMLTERDFRTGLFTSPHITTAIERVSIDGLLISPDDFTRLTWQVKDAVGSLQSKNPEFLPTYFDATLAIALLHFKNEKCDFVILEAGIGGQHDSTNVIEQPLVAAITNIGIDHTEFLGKTLASIAKDKAGMIKKGTHFTTTEQRPRLLKIFKDECQSHTATFEHIRTVGDYANDNIALAYAICKKVLPKAGLEIKAAPKVRLPARFETMQMNPKVIVDGAHNVSKMQSTVLNLEKEDQKVCLVFALSLDKSPEPILKLLLPKVERVFFTQFTLKSRKCHDPIALSRIAKKLGFPQDKIICDGNPLTAFETAIDVAGRKGLVLVTGSFYLAGDIRKLYYPENYILEHRKVS